MNTFTSEQIGQALSTALATDRLHLILLPTEKCNFRCTYCYEDFAIGRMSLETQHSVKAFLTNTAPHLNHLTFGWFGGEPLLARQIVLDITSHAQQIAKTVGLSSFSAGMTTNGYLLHLDLFEQLVSLDVRYFQISLDGYREGHDITRRRASGDGSFDTIWANLLKTRDCKEEFTITIRVHLTPSNEASVADLVEAICEMFRGDSRFRVAFHRIENLGGPLSADIRVVPISNLTHLPRFISRIREAGLAAWSAAGEAESATFASSELPYICYASKPNSLLIRADGRVGKCTVALTSAANDVGKLMPTGIVEFNDNIQHWTRGFKGLNLSTLACPLHPH